MKFIPFILCLFIASVSYGQQTTSEKETVRIDTVITFDPETFEETIEVVVYKGEKTADEVADFTYKTDGTSTRDTIIIFDPETRKEDTIIVVNPRNN